MSDNSAIEWTDASWNPARGCDKVSAGCKNCYAETFSERFRGVPGHPFEQGFDLRLVPEALSKPLTWKKSRRIFVNSMSDLFHKEIPNEYIAAVFGVMAACPQHTFQILTKRADRFPEWFAWLAETGKGELGGDLEVRLCLAALFKHQIFWDRHIPYPSWPLPNVHVGVSAENQETADERIPHLLRTPAAVRFVSAEPLLGPLRVDDISDGQGGVLKPLVGLHWVPGHDRYGSPGMVLSGGKGPKLDWVIVGGESGPGARSMDIAWARSIVAQCKAAGTAVFVKQLGANLKWDPDGEQWWKGPFTHKDGSPRLADRKGGDMSEWPEDLRVREFPVGAAQ